MRNAGLPNNDTMAITSYIQGLKSHLQEKVRDKEANDNINFTSMIALRQDGSF